MRGNSADNSKMAVANVNKSKATSSKAKKHKAEHELPQPRSNKVDRQTQEPQISDPQAEVNDDQQQVVFNEEGHRVQMTVVGATRHRDFNDPQDLSDDDSEDEVQFKTPQLSEGEIPDNNETARALDQRQQLLLENQDKRERIRCIDMEMKQRIQELHALMTDGGLVESAQLLGELTPEMVNTNPVPQQGAGNFNSNNVQLSNTNANATTRVNPNNPRSEGNVCRGVASEETIYTRAVDTKRNSLSSEDEPLNSSNDLEVPRLINDLIISGRRAVESDLDQPRPGCSYEQTQGRPEDDQIEAQSADHISPEERARQIVREAERAKAKIYATKGNQDKFVDINNSFVHSAMVDEEYMVIGGHLDDPTIGKIVNGEYVDFGKLVPRDKILTEEDGRLEMVIRGGRTFWVPVNEGVNISGFTRWEQAFHVFSNIYTKTHPHRSAELIQYNHIIHTISLTYMWDNVYMYDKEFRMHMGRNPGRSWSVILHQAWAMPLKDCIYRHEQGNNYSVRGGNNNNNTGLKDRIKVNEPCRRFNRGKCNFGVNCKYEHRCNYCHKFGHGVQSCRKLAADKQLTDGPKKDDSNPNAPKPGPVHQVSK